MKRTLSAIVVAGLLLAAQPAFAQSPRPPRATRVGAEEPAALPLRRLILYSNGVAYFERRGVVSGSAEINLPFKQSQVDDVLKSLVVLDLGRGRIGAVSYNSSAPASARLAEIPFSVEAKTDGDEDGGLAEVLRQLQGSRVAVTSARGAIAGKVLTVEERTLPAAEDRPADRRHSLVVASEAGEISSVDLDEIRSVRVLDEGARRDIDTFADVAASARRRDAKTIVVTSEGSGPRELVVSYTIAAPIWKTSYRVVLDAEGRPFFQGWAIVDNVSEEDWRDVSLSLVSGSPVSFIQPLQQPLFRHRPVVPIPEDLALEPQVYEPEVGGEIGGVAGGVGNGSGGGVGPGAGFNMGGGSPGIGGIDNNDNLATTLSDAIARETSGVAAAATGVELSDLFEYRIDRPVTVGRGRSALIPILQTRMDGERVSVYRPGMGDRPHAGLRLVNTSALTLEAGPMTVIDGNAYAGEALVERLKPGENRFITYALDLATLVTVTSETGREPVFLVRAVNGSLQTHFYEAETKLYTLTNQTDRPRVVFVEHPARQDWRLSDASATPAERTPSAYRFKVELAPRATAAVRVAERRALMTTYVLSSLSQDAVNLLVASRSIDDATRAELQGIIDLRAAVAAAEKRIEAIDAEIKEIEEDQARVRENIESLNGSAQARDLIARYVAKAGAQETRIEQLRESRRAAVAERERLSAELARVVSALALERRQ